jgi:hypothetical protein
MRAVVVYTTPVKLGAAGLNAGLHSSACMHPPAAHPTTEITSAHCAERFGNTRTVGDIAPDRVLLLFCFEKKLGCSSPPLGVSMGGPSVDVSRVSLSPPVPGANPGSLAGPMSRSASTPKDLATSCRGALSPTPSPPRACTSLSSPPALSCSDSRAVERFEWRLSRSRSFCMSSELACSSFICSTTLLADNSSFWPRRTSISLPNPIARFSCNQYTLTLVET